MPRAAWRASTLPSASARIAKPTALTASLRHYQSSSKSHQASPAPAKPSAPTGSDTFINTTNAYYAEEMHKLWKQDRSSVHASWDVYFTGLANGLPSEQAYRAPPTLMPLPMEAPPVDVSGFSGSTQAVDDHLKVRPLLSALSPNLFIARH
jgi:2-oxoglutarate dehydrogenase E1 component